MNAIFKQSYRKKLTHLWWNFWLHNRYPARWHFWTCGVVAFTQTPTNSLITDITHADEE